MEAQGHLRTYKEEKGPTYLFVDIDLTARTEQDKEFVEAILAQGRFQVVPTQTETGVQLRWYKAVR